MKNKEKFERTYNEIHAPEALVWKVMDMSKEMEIKKFKIRNVVKYALCALVVMVVTFMASNGICYATTGESLVNKIKVTINGEEKQVDINWTKEGDTYQGTVTIPGKKSSDTTVTIYEENTPEFTGDIVVEEGEDGAKSITVTDTIGFEANADSVSIENVVKTEE